MISFLHSQLQSITIPKVNCSVWDTKRIKGYCLQRQYSVNIKNKRFYSYKVFFEISHYSDFYSVQLLTGSSHYKSSETQLRKIVIPNAFLSYYDHVLLQVRFVSFRDPNPSLLR